METMEILKKDVKFRCQLLSRMITDCNYYLGYGNRHEKYLWSGNVQDHIQDMEAIYNSFTEEQKPEWINLEKIREYKRKMEE